MDAVAVPGIPSLAPPGAGAVCHDVDAGGDGATAGRLRSGHGLQARLESIPYGERSGSPAQRPGEGDSGQPTGARNPPARARVRRARFRAGRPVSTAEAPWRVQVAAVLRGWGFGSKARSFETCGRTALVRVCAGCREVHSAEVRVSCGLRGCPLCEKRAASERAARVAGAALRVPELVRLRAAGVRAEVEADLRAAMEARDLWRGREAASRERHAKTGRVRDLESAEGHALRAARAEVRRARFRRWATETARPEVWRWRLVTVSPRWSPGDPRDYSVGGLKRRLHDLRARCRDLWEHALRVGGLAAATWRVELNDAGHVHAHALYFGPWQAAKHLAKVAGCYVDVREVDVFKGRGGADAVASMRGAVVEATKYALKGPGAAPEWLAGEHRRVAHPELVAAWIVATEDQQLVTHRGVMRDALAAEELAPQVEERAPEPAPVCRGCGREVCPIGEVWPLQKLARELPRVWWRERVAWVAFRL